MRRLLSEFEREIDGAGPLIEAKEVSDLRRELHAGCVLIRESLGSLSDRTLKLQRVSQRHEQRAPRTVEGPLTDEEKVRAGLRPELWPRA